MHAEYAGADPGYFLGGGALVSCSTSTPINQIVFFFCRIPVVLENRRSSQGGGGRVRTPCTLPLDPPLHLRALSIQPKIPEILVGNQMERTNSIRSDRNICNNL